MYPFSTWRPKDSATSITPIRIRKESARTFMVGWRSMKSPIEPAKTIMTPIATTIAATMTGRSFDIPTAVMTESSEKTMSSSPIWTTTDQNALALTGFASAACCTSSLSWISTVAFPTRKSPPESRMRSRPETPWPRNEKSSRVSPITHVMAKRSPSRVTRATTSPSLRAPGCCSFGRRPERMDRKTMLSTPRTISISASVASEIQASGERSRSSMAGSNCPITGSLSSVRTPRGSSPLRHRGRGSGRGSGRRLVAPRLRIGAQDELPPRLHRLEVGDRLGDREEQVRQAGLREQLARQLPRGPRAADDERAQPLLPPLLEAEERVDHLPVAREGRAVAGEDDVELELPHPPDALLV